LRPEDKEDEESYDEYGSSSNDDEVSVQSDDDSCKEEKGSSTNLRRLATGAAVGREVGGEFVPPEVTVPAKAIASTTFCTELVLVLFNTPHIVITDLKDNVLRFLEDALVGANENEGWLVGDGRYIFLI
jgi:hypothetical protein